MKPREWAGVRMGMLTGIRMVGSEKNQAVWLWLCDCGNEVVRSGIYVKNSVNRGCKANCGCWTTEAKRQNGHRNKTHGFSKTKLYDVHRQMLRRCYDENCKDYKMYGARGISVCQEWQEIGAFVAWAAESGYGEGLTIERENNNGDYSPLNCRWIPNERQARNTRRIVWVTALGKTQSISDWARETGMHVQTLIGRLRRNWSHHDAVTINPVFGRNQYGG